VAILADQRRSELNRWPAGLTVWWHELRLGQLTVIALALACGGLLWCGGMTQGNPDDSGVSSCTYYFSEPETICEESDSAAALDRCHHVLDDLIDGGLDVEILPHRCATNGGGCCAFNDDSGVWNVCYYGDAFTPTVVQGACALADAHWVSSP